MTNDIIAENRLASQFASLVNPTEMRVLFGTCKRTQDVPVEQERRCQCGAFRFDHEQRCVECVNKEAL